jgi:GAF domain-containing protein
MLKPIIPPNELERLKDLFSLDLLDSKPNVVLDNITSLAQQVFQVSSVLITLVYSNVHWFKSKQNFKATETPREISFCGHVILQDHFFEISDTHADSRFIDNPLVTGDPKIRFYAGVPIKSENGNNIGTICLIDYAPRTLSQQE